MREVKTEFKAFEVRGLTRGEIKVLEDKGYPISRDGILFDKLDKEPGANDAFYDEFIAAGVKDAYEPMDIIPADDKELFKATYAETFGNRDEEKNLPRSGDGPQTEAE